VRACIEAHAATPEIACVLIELGEHRPSKTLTAHRAVKPHPLNFSGRISEHPNRAAANGAVANPGDEKRAMGSSQLLGRYGSGVSCVEATRRTFCQLVEVRRSKLWARSLSGDSGLITTSFASIASTSINPLRRV
jgi:hypothetical protein